MVVVSSACTVNFIWPLARYLEVTKRKMQTATTVVVAAYHGARRTDNVLMSAETICITRTRNSQALASDIALSLKFVSNWLIIDTMRCFLSKSKGKDGNN